MSFPSAAGGQSFVPHLGAIGLLCLLLLLPAAPEGDTADSAPAAGPVPAAAPLIVDDQHRLEASYVPGGLRESGTVLLAAEAAEAFTAMVRDAASAGVAITGVSGYRSYSEQHSLHLEYIARYGYDNARAISAPAGASEHQTGLAVDIGNPDGNCGLLECFAGTPAGQFAAQEAWRYGFIIRYPQGASEITGYSYEPWHLRYVGPDTAALMRNNGQPILERFLLMRT